jgi:hypothetical protein
LSAILAEEEEEKPRLYSKGFKDRVPVDEVAPQHMVAHGLLIRWGLWCNSRSSGSSLASAEALYSGKGMLPPATAPLGADPQVMLVERCVIRMPMQHGDTLGMLYVRRLSPSSICRAMNLQFERWPKWIFDARCMLVNLMRRHA